MQRSVLSFIVIIAFGVGAAIFVVKKGNDAADEIQRLNSEVFAVHRAAFVQQLDDESGNNIVDIPNWKTYRNEKYGFEIKYPSDLKLEESTDRHSMFSVNVERGIFFIEISLLKEPINQWLNELEEVRAYKERMERVTKEIGYYDGNTFSISSTTFDGFPARTLEYCYEGCGKGFEITRNNLVYSIDKSDLEECLGCDKPQGSNVLRDKIFSTFKFIK